jgi:hypothetical protein
MKVQINQGVWSIRKNQKFNLLDIIMQKTTSKKIIIGYLFK